MNNWITTYTGRKFHVFEPRPEDVDIRDIAHALSLQCRFTGHCSRLWTVGQHSILVYEMAPDHLKREALLHDAAEAYLCDVARPVKQHPDFALYRQTEYYLMATIAEVLKLSWPMSPDVHEYDDRALAIEAYNLLPNVDGWGPLANYKMDDEDIFIDLVSLSPQQVEQYFLEAWRLLNE